MREPVFVKTMTNAKTTAKNAVAGNTGFSLIKNVLGTLQKTNVQTTQKDVRKKQHVVIMMMTRGAAKAWTKSAVLLILIVKSGEILQPD